MLKFGLSFGNKGRGGIPDDLYPSAFFNGMDFRLATYTGGPTYVPDHIGVLRSPGANRPAVQGMRLATTVADGAVLGPEKAVNGSFDSATGWNIGSSAWSISDGKATLATTSVYGSSITQNIGYVANSIVQISIELDVTGGTIELWISSDTSTDYRVASYTSATSGSHTFVTSRAGSKGTLYIRTLSSGSSGSVYNISVKEVIPTYVTTDSSGNPIIDSTPQKTVTYSEDWATKSFAETFDKFDISDPLKAPGFLCEPVRTNYALNSATPATHTTGSLAVGTYTLWQDGTGSIVATAGTAVGTFGTASDGTPAGITITTSGTVVLTASGTNTWVQLERGAFKTSRIPTTTATATRAATVASFPTAGKIPVNDFAIRMIVVPSTSGQSGVYLFGSYVDANNYTAILVSPTEITLRKRLAGVNTDATVIITHTEDTPLDLILYASQSTGMQISARAFSSSWGAFTDGAVNSTEAAKANAQIAATYRLGDLNGSQFTGHVSLFDSVPIPTGTTDPMAWAKTHWGVA